MGDDGDFLLGEALPAPEQRLERFARQVVEHDEVPPAFVHDAEPPRDERRPLATLEGGALGPHVGARGKGARFRAPIVRAGVAGVLSVLCGRVRTRGAGGTGAGWRAFALLRVHPGQEGAGGLLRLRLANELQDRVRAFGALRSEGGAIRA